MVPTSLITQLRKIATTPVAEEEHCKFCGAVLPEDHRHLVDISATRFFCICEMCIITQAEHSHFQPLPQRYVHLENFIMPEELWSDFLIPVNMAFFIKNTARGGTIAFYPAPAGATQSQLNMEPWQRLEILNAELKDMMPDVEALLINRLNTTNDYFIVPVDSCYRLIGMIRKGWQGLHGGKEVNDIINNYFNELKDKSEKCLT